MEYAQLNEAGTEATQITTHGNVEWDADNFCSAEALVKDGKAGQFRVVPLMSTEQPAHDPLTQRCYRDGCELVGGDWRYRWVTVALDAEQIAANQAAAAAAQRKAAKAQRAAVVSAIKVTTQAGNTFDGDEISQDRMARAILGLSSGLATSVTWVLADNTVIAATGAELTEALALAGSAQAAIWVLPE